MSPLVTEGFLLEKIKSTIDTIDTNRVITTIDTIDTNSKYKKFDCDLLYEDMQELVGSSDYRLFSSEWGLACSDVRR